MPSAEMLMGSSKTFCQEEHVLIHLSVIVQTVKLVIVKEIL